MATDNDLTSMKVQCWHAAIPIAACMHYICMLAEFRQSSFKTDKAVEVGPPWQPTLLQTEIP